MLLYLSKTRCCLNCSEELKGSVLKKCDIIQKQLVMFLSLFRRAKHLIRIIKVRTLCKQKGKQRKIWDNSGKNSPYMYTNDTHKRYNPLGLIHPKWAVTKFVLTYIESKVIPYFFRRDLTSNY